MYSNTIKDHAINPRNRRELNDADIIVEAKYPPCGDKLRLYLKLQNETIGVATFTASACGPAVAAASLATTLLVGRTLAEARQIGAFELQRSLGGLPPSKRHAILLVLECLHEANAHHQTNS
jgi:NifU-like protein involved in Fe-S cluster formation